jgi:hypothetical protein
MYLARIAHAMWLTKWRCLLLLLISVAIAIALTFNVSVPHRTLHAKPLSFGVAQTQVLVDSGQSPLADSTVLTEDIDLLAGDLGEVMGAPRVVDAIARSVNVPSSRISTQSQLVQDVPLAATDALEAQRGTQIIDSGRHYSILVRVDAETFVMQIFTQAPTGAEAIRMANAGAKALSGYVASLVRTERVKKDQAVILRQVEPAFGGTVDGSLASSAAVLLSAVLFILGLSAMFAIRRWRAAWV